jgi:poly-gamma-glutamate capsule biosynthesis protein CapA/YwtB (metallophosphatase superfamily)
MRGAAPWTSEPALLLDGRMGVLGYCLRPRQYASAVPPYAEGTQEQICADVRRLCASGAMVAVSLHWGEEFVPLPSRDEVALGHAIIDAGAALILGHHPHVIRPVERYKDGIIAYSLGNFMGDMTWYAPFRRGAIVRCHLTDGRPTDVAVTATQLRDDYRPALTVERDAVPLVGDPVPCLASDAYARAIDDTWRRQRVASYRSALRNLPRTPLAVAAQLFTETIRNKIAGLGARLGRRPQK